ncbi:MAG: hypothetical protein RPU34_04100 [Candidatus Sedimenticola sp. (ex Thyasira tokunagai)]
MIVGIAAPYYDLDGALLLDERDVDLSTTRLEDVTRRVTRTATLDGGSFTTDLGYSDSDRDIIITLKSPSESRIATVHNLLKNYSMVFLSLSDGCFNAVLSEFKQTGSNYTLTAKIKNRA